jgi:hypothetical protein
MDLCSRPRIPRWDIERSGLKPRHYERTEALVRRTAADTPPAFRSARVFIAPFTEGLLDPKPEEPSLVSSAEGRVASMLLTVPAYAVASPSLASAYRDLLGKLGQTVDLVALTHESVAGEVEGWLKEGTDATTRSQVVAAPDHHLNFSVWAEDSYVVITDGAAATYFMEPFSFPRYGDSLVADFVSNATGLKKTQAPLYFQGGNVLIGDDFFFIGADYPANSLHFVGPIVVPRPQETPPQLIERLYREYLDTARRLIYVGATIPVPAEERRPFRMNGDEWQELLDVGNRPGTSQPIFHIDMFVSLAGRGADGRYRVLVGDPGMAADLLEQPRHPHAMQEVFDNIARALADRLGFDVIRNPVPHVYVDDPDVRERVWYFATTNNALVQGAGTSGAAVFLPTYGHGGWSLLSVTAARTNRSGSGWATAPSCAATSTRSPRTSARSTASRSTCADTRLSPRPGRVPGPGGGSQHDASSRAPRVVELAGPTRCRRRADRRSPDERSRSAAPGCPLPPEVGSRGDRASRPRSVLWSGSSGHADAYRCRAPTEQTPTAGFASAFQDEKGERARRGRRGRTAT